ncbi:cytochrome b [Thalassomonas actiniarum]|uniref:Cytochrome b/b6 domain-containing protein n=1 Tax=Thalassomonas actiniarum TaxID=485447 RepID=A0AAE9YXB2_9GAMM|nr:cytochrome b/b6 domain-containing protein [Thalassomonas actiniarum]WDE02119.1 cytochrome b/b6 domain-containing protein [Thalassomonas actiniarum]
MIASNEKYNKKTRFFHWLSAVVILWVTISGFYVTLFEVDAELKNSVLALNVLMNTFFIPVFMFRVLNWVNNPAPEDYQGLPLRSRKIADKVHAGMYLLIFIVLLSGVLMMDRKVEFLGMTLIPYLPFDPALKEFFTRLHIFSVCALAFCVALHIAAVIRHELSGLRILKRMLG